MAEPKTKMTTENPKDFIARISDDDTREDCLIIMKLMKEVTGKQAKMWGPSIIGYDTYTLAYANGKSAEWPRMAFSPRKQTLTLYVLQDFPGSEELFGRLGKFKLSKACVYIKSLDDVDLKVLKQIFRKSHSAMNKKYPKKA